MTSEDKTCEACGEPLETSKEIEEGHCYDCMGYIDDEGDPMERNMNEQMLINLGM